MALRSHTYIAMLVDMFGEDIVNSMLNNNFSLNSKGLSESSQEIIQNHLNMISRKLDIDILETYKEWVFDFPGWVGCLDFSNGNPARELIVIGEDPHLTGNLSSFDVYCAYGMCHERVLLNERLWQIVPYAFGHNNSINIKDNMECLKNYYATDLCYMSPKGVSAEEKKTSVLLRKIRARIGKSFVLRQIEIIKPKYVVCNGSTSYEYLKKNIFTSCSNERKEEFTHKIRKKSVYLKAFDTDSGVIVLSFPHFTKSHNGFWNKSSKESRVLLNKLI